jgi:hypothetical protein
VIPDRPRDGCRSPHGPGAARDRRAEALEVDPALVVVELLA